MSVPSVRTHADAVVDALDGAGVNVGDGKAPEGPLPYAVVYDIAGPPLSGTLEEPNEDGELVYQVTCVGSTAEQARWMCDKVITTLLAGLTVAGRRIALVSIDNTPSVLRDDDINPPVFFATPRFRLKTTPG
jgi:hypothetical protein